MTQMERMRLAVETKVSLSTVAKWDKGGTINESLDRLLLRTASELGLTRENATPKGGQDG